MNETHGDSLRVPQLSLSVAEAAECNVAAFRQPTSFNKYHRGVKLESSQTLNNNQNIKASQPQANSQVGI